MKLTNILETEYQDITEKKSLDVKQDSSDTVLMQAWKEWILKENFIDSIFVINNNSAYKSARDILKKRRYTQADITDSCFTINPSEERYGEYAFGTFISASIAEHYERAKQEQFGVDNYKIIIPPFFEKMYCIGFSNRDAKIEIFGNAGEHLGFCMKSGTIIVNGNVGDNTGWGMDRGKITIHGNAGEETGYYMCEGIIEIMGNTGRYSGFKRRGGTIIVKGRRR